MAHKRPVIDDIDEWLWGAGYTKCRPITDLEAPPRVSCHLPPLPEPIQQGVVCAGCGKPVPLEDHYALDGLPYHRVCLPEHPLLVKGQGGLACGSL